MATVFVNGIPSAQTLVSVDPFSITLTGAQRQSNGAFQFSFTNLPGLSFSSLAATNVALPLNNWSVLGSVTEVTAGHYLFTDYATNNPQRFYRVRWP
jgi:hypothetical protein